MDSLTFAARVIEALAWPVTALASVLLLRRALERIIPKLRRFRYKDVDVEFGAETELKAELLKEVTKETQGVQAPKPLAAPDPAAEADREWSFSRLVLDALVKDKGPFPRSKLRSEAKISVGTTVTYADAIIETGWVTYVVEVKIPRDDAAVGRAVQTAMRNAQAYALYLGQERGMRWFVQPLVVIPADKPSGNRIYNVPVLKFDAVNEEFPNLKDLGLNNLMGALISEPR